MTTYYLDMDGVLVDFIGGALRAMGLPDTDEQRQKCTHWNSLGELAEQNGLCEQGHGQDYVWAVVDAAGERFWADLEWLPEGQALLTQLLLADLPVVFVSAPSRHASSGAGKMLWLAENLPHDPYQGKPLHRRFALCPAKHLLAHSNAVLVDDRDANCRRFFEAGGRAILWPQYWNAYGVWVDNAPPPALRQYRMALLKRLRGGL